jgi:hypothetical protein
MAWVVPAVLGAAFGGAALYGGYLFVQRRAGDDGLAPLPTKPQGPSIGPVGPVGPQDPVGPAVRIEDYVGKFEAGKWHETQKGNGLSAVATGVANKLAPGAGSNPTMVRAIKRLINSSPINRELFGVQDPNVKDNVGGWHVEKAFAPRHEDTIGVVRLGFRPRRYINGSGVKLSGSPGKWGDVFVPLINRDAVAAGITDPALLLAPSWPDGSNPLDPPATLLASLRSRAA